MKFLLDLNPVQRDAVTHTEGPLLILAGAGSGKTRVLTYRIAYLIKELGVSPYHILAITFTNKAANEMRERVSSLVGPLTGVPTQPGSTEVTTRSNSRGMWIMTFHAACAQMLRREIQHLSAPPGKPGYKRNFVIYDDDDSLRLIKMCLKDLNIDPKRYPPQAIQAGIEAAKNELIDADSFASRASTYLERVTSDIYKLYQDRLYQNNALDFGDLIMVCVDILRLFPEVLKRYQERFQYILVDEYQDTNHAQYVWVNLLAKAHRNLCVVGDDDQSIYGFRGADIRNILEFENDYPDARVVKLEQNYRSTQVILDAANYVVSHNMGRKPKTLWTSNARGEVITTYQAESEHDEAAFVASEIKRLNELESRSYKDFALFYRTNAQSRVLEEVFIRMGTPYRVVGGLRFYERREIKDILAYLRAISNPEDTVSLKRIINRPKREIGEVTVSLLDRFSQKEGITFYEAMKRVGEMGLMQPRARSAVSALLEMLEDIRGIVSDTSLVGLTTRILESTGYIAELEAENNVEAMGRIENLQEFVSVVKEFEDAFPENSLDDFLEGVSLITSIDTYKEGEEAVTLMTLHNAKGLEFPVVFVVGMEDGVFPHIRSLGSPEALEEERRLCYVGITRAKERLYLTHAWSRNLYGSTNYNVASRFLREIPEELTQQAEHYEPAVGKEIPAFMVGDEVWHRKWGPGKVVEVKNPQEVTVVFIAEGEKRLLLDYAPLEKIEPPLS